MNFLSTVGLPSWSKAPAREGEALAHALKLAGYHGFQAPAPDETMMSAGLEMSGHARVLDPRDIDELASRHKGWGFVGTSLHLGIGLEADDDLNRYADSVLNAIQRHNYPLFVETHRGTITQDARRTIDLVSRFPDLRFNADLSHWYTGQEMVYGDLSARLDALKAVFDRVRYVHGRVGDSCCMQTSIYDNIGRERPQVAHFRDMWTRCFRGFLSDPSADRHIVFATELLPNAVPFAGQIYQINYARLLPDGNEETDRWIESITLCEIAFECFNAALESIPTVARNH